MTWQVTRVKLSELDKKIISRLQGDLPLVEFPFKQLAAEVGTTEEEVLERVQSYLDAGIMRRLGTILRHHLAGFTVNAMCCWVVPEEKVEETGNIMASFKEASHVYQRPTFHDWPYNLFTMLHGKSEEELQKVAAEISAQTGIKEYRLLYSTREYKKTSMKYF